MSKGKLLALCVIWLLVAAGVAAAYKLIILPKKQGSAVSQSGSSSHYEHDINFALDSFSGYAVLRSDDFRQELANKKIRLNLMDDGADYAARIDALASGKVDLAVFTIDALIKVCADLDYVPGTIVAMIDETRGADAMVAYKKAVPNLDALNRPDMKFVLTTDSPSETFARVRDVALQSRQPEPRSICREIGCRTGLSCLSNCRRDDSPGFCTVGAVRFEGITKSEHAYRGRQFQLPRLYRRRNRGQP